MLFKIILEVLRFMKKLKKTRQTVLVSTILLVLTLTGCSKPGIKDYMSKEIPIGDSTMRVAIYGEVYNQEELSFVNTEKDTLVMLPALGVASPHIYFKPLAQRLLTNFNVIIIEPLGYGLSGLATTDRSVENITTEISDALEYLEIKECMLLTHSISGVYGLDFVQNHPDKVKGIIGIDNTVYDDILAENMDAEIEYMGNILASFEEVRQSFKTIEEFHNAIKQNPESYDAQLPPIEDYEYSDADISEYMEAFSTSNNESIQNELINMSETVLSIKDVKYSEKTPVLSIISADNVAMVPSWETAHAAQLSLQSAIHEMHTIEGSHYIWYSNLDGVVELIEEWYTNND